MYKTEIFVFGANEAGIHGAGAAQTARVKFGARYGQGYGLQGRSFGIPTKNRKIKPLSLTMVKSYVDRFITFAQKHPEYSFNVTRVGCGLSKMKDSDIAPMFKNAPKNCVFDIVWEPFLGENFQYFSKEF